MQNFWEKSGWQHEDKHLEELKKAPFRRKWPVLPEGPGLFLIRGPRQIGKSSWLKSMLLKDDPQRAFYISCEMIADYKELFEVIKTIPERKILYFDEISFVSEWWRAIKLILDQKPDLRIVATGSHAFDLKKGMDQMPGRWGNGGEYELLPMDFFEFSEMRVQARWEKLEWVQELELYFQVGGFPAALAEAGPEGKKPTKSFEVYRRWLLGDLLKIGRSEVYLREVISQIALTMSTPLSLQKLAQKTQLGSHNTAQDYVELLESCFALKTLYEMDIDSWSPKFRKEKKFYFCDPSIYWIALTWGDNTPPKNYNDILAEMVAHEYLSRRFRKLGFYKNKNGEVDFVGSPSWAVEVKWANFPENLSKAYKDLSFQDKIVWTKNNFLKTELK